MDKETKRIVAIISIILAVLVVVMLILSGYDLSGFEIHGDIKIN